MKKIVLLVMLLLSSLNGWTQNPTIEGDLLLCPFTDGTAQITNSQTYDTYQWYYKYWFLPDEYQAIADATSASFTYDWMTYDQALLKVVVTLNGTTYESNEIQIDSWNWVGMFLMIDENEDVTFDPNTETYLLCEGGSFGLSINNPPYDTNIVWYKDDVAIEGADLSSYTVTEPGFYYVSAAPSFCPDNSNNSLGVLVAWDPNCSLSVTNPELQPLVTIYPNPVKNEIFIDAVSVPLESYILVDLTGKVISKGTINQNENKIAVGNLSKGIYALQLYGENHSSVHKIVKE